MGGFAEDGSAEVPLITVNQARRLMDEYTKDGRVGKAAMMAGMHRNTARKHLKQPVIEGAVIPARHWRTREDPFEEDKDWITAQLRQMPGLEALTLFEELRALRPGKYEEGQVRTLQRRIRSWRGTEGPPKEVYFSQEHRPGEAFQTDFTEGRSLGITIAGEALGHLLCHAVLPYSNWEWVTVCGSESMLALRRGVLAAVRQLQKITEYHQTDNSTAATHRVGKGRKFNEEYQSWIESLGMKPRTTAVGCKEQNGDVEASNGQLKRRLEQQLLLRGSRDFQSVAAYEQWLEAIVVVQNRKRDKRLAEELAQMRPVNLAGISDFFEREVRVTAWGTVRVMKNAYSVPSRLIGLKVKVRSTETHLEIFYNSKSQLQVERLSGINGRRIDYRHLIWSLVRKPGAFARYRYREELFPSLAFRRAYDALRLGRSELDADREYLRLLHLAASTMEAEVEQALVQLLERGETPTKEMVGKLIGERSQEAPPRLEAPVIDLSSFDELLREVRA